MHQRCSRRNFLRQSTLGAAVVPAMGAALFSPAVAAAQAATQSPIPSLVVVKSVNLRAGPSTSAAVLGSLPRDARVIAVERRGNWIHVQFANGAGKPLDGWAFKSFLQDVEKSTTPAAK